ncbi:uncharacterized protein LOC144107782 isoform X1 [Amblyomma americanum]
MASINLEATRDLLLLYQTLTDAEEQCDNLCEDRTMLKFLVYVLEETTDEIALLSLKVLAALCADDCRCNLVAQTFGLAPSLELLSSGEHEFAVKESALRLKMRLLEAKVALLTKQQEDAANLRLFSDSLSSRQGGEATKATPPRPKCPSLLGQHNSTAKVVSLHIEGLYTQSDKERCEEILLNMRGVISFTFDMERRRCVVRIKSDLSPRMLIQAIKSTGTMSAMQVANSAAPRLPSKSMGTPSSEAILREDECETAASHEAKKEENLPAYLPEAASPIREDAVVRHKMSRSSSAAGWLGAAATFITKSLYW